MADARTRGWGAPCTGRMVTLVRDDGLRLPVRAELADLTAMLLDLTELAHGYDVLPGQTWGYACRHISGTTVWSNHAWGLADDLNAPANPYASAEWHRRNARGPWPNLVCDIPPGVVELWEAHGYRWGGRYVTKPDPMHMEFMGTPADAAAITQRLRDFLGGTTPPPPAPAPPPAPSPLEYDMDTLDLSAVGAGSSTFVKGRHVDNLQALLIATWQVIVPVRQHIGGMVNGYGLPDGIAGPATKAALVEFQRHVGIKTDAVCGPVTWRRLIEF